MSDFLNISDFLLQIAKELLKRETLNYDDVVALIGPPLHGNKKLIAPVEFEASVQVKPEDNGTGDKNSDHTFKSDEKVWQCYCDLFIYSDNGIIVYTNRSRYSFFSQVVIKNVESV